MVTDAQKLSIQKYRQEKRDQLSVDVPKGKRDAYKAIAAELGLSLSILIQRGVESYAGFQNVESIKPASINKQQTAEKLSAADRVLLGEFNRLPADVQKAFIKTFKAINASNDAKEKNTLPIDASN